MTRRFIHSICFRWLATLLLLSSLMHAPLAHAEEITINQAHLESSEDGYRLSATFSFELNHSLEDAINHGIPLHFTTQLKMTQPRWYWFDESTIEVQRTIRISKNLLTNAYQATILGGVQQNFNTLEEALALLRRPSRWIVAERGALKIGATYKVSVRMLLDLDFLSKPLQINSFNNSDWRLASDWKTFSFKAE